MSLNSSTAPSGVPGQMGAAPTPDSLDDPIIQQILVELGLDVKTMSEDEIERHRRLCSMLRNSKRYKRFRVDDANKRWDDDSRSFTQMDLFISDVSDTATECSSSSCIPAFLPIIQSLKDDADLPQKRRVSFSDKVRVIQLSTHSLESLFGSEKTDNRPITSLESLMRHLKSFFKRSG